MGFHVTKEIPRKPHGVANSRLRWSQRLQRPFGPPHPEGFSQDSCRMILIYSSVMFCLQSQVQVTYEAGLVPLIQ